MDPNGGPKEGMAFRQSQGGPGAVQIRPDGQNGFHPAAADGRQDLLPVGIKGRVVVMGVGIKDPGKGFHGRTS